MKLDINLLTASNLLAATSLADRKGQGYFSGEWVHLLALPGKFSFDEALLLCQSDDRGWVTWIPDFGEAILDDRQFCSIY